MGKEVTVIPAIRKEQEIRKRQIRVAAYCRVSTDQEEQLGSFENQVEYYTRLIAEKEDWEFAGIYADEGISGTGTRKRKGFRKMIQACDDGKVDLVVTKSISRFARNTADCLLYARRLKDRGIPILFEKEHINTMEASGELLFTILSCFAQEESRSISENTQWGIRSKFQQGIPHINTGRFLGFDKAEDGQLKINPEQAVVVRRIFHEYLDGWGEAEIAKRLREENIPGVTGEAAWSSVTVRRMLSNEKYKGDLIMQKYYTVSFLTKELAVNEGKLDKYEVKGAHEAIVSRQEWEAAQEERKRRASYRRRHGAKKLSSGIQDPFCAKIWCAACGGMVVRGYGKKGREPFRRCIRARRDHGEPRYYQEPDRTELYETLKEEPEGENAVTVFPEAEICGAVRAAWQQIVSEREAYLPGWERMLEKGSPLEKLRARQMLALTGGQEPRTTPLPVFGNPAPTAHPAPAMRKGIDSEGKADDLDALIRMVLESITAYEDGYLIQFLDGNRMFMPIPR